MVSALSSSHSTRGCFAQTTAQSHSTTHEDAFPSPRPNFYDFVEKLSEITDRAEHEFNVKRVNPKRMKVKVLTTNAMIKQLIDIFNAQDVLTLELPELLDEIGSLINESSHFESRFEDARESEFEFVDDDFCARGEVPMELDADG